MRLALVVPGSDGTVGGPGGTQLDPSVATASSGSIMQRVTISQPASGSEWALTLPTAGQSWDSTTGRVGSGVVYPNGVWLRLLTAVATLTFGGVSATNRFCGYQVLDGLGIPIQRNIHAAALTNVSPAQMITYGISQAAGSGGSADGVRDVNLELPGGVILQPGWAWQGYSYVQPGDRYSKVDAWFEMWTSQPLYDPYGPLLV